MLLNHKYMSFCFKLCRNKKYLIDFHKLKTNPLILQVVLTPMGYDKYPYIKTLLIRGCSPSLKLSLSLSLSDSDKDVLFAALCSCRVLFSGVFIQSRICLLQVPIFKKNNFSSYHVWITTSNISPQATYVSQKMTENI